MGAGVFKGLSHGNIVVQVILGATGIQDVSGIAQSDFGHFARFTNGLDGSFHIVQTVQAVKDTEDVDAVFGC